MAIPPDLDINIAMQRLDALSAKVADALARLEEIGHRVRTLESVRRLDGLDPDADILTGADIGLLPPIDEDVRDDMSGDIAVRGE